MFRNHKFSPSVPAPSPVEEDYLSSEVVEDTERVILCKRPVSSKLPDFDDYNLSALLNTGQPLNRVSPVLFHDDESEASRIIESLTSSDKPVTEQVTEQVSNISNNE